MSCNKLTGLIKLNRLWLKLVLIVPSVAFGQTFPRLALQYWQSDDFPNRPSGFHIEYEEIWHDPWCEYNWECHEENGELVCEDVEDCHSGYYETVTVYVTDYAPDGFWGSTWVGYTLSPSNQVAYNINGNESVYTPLSTLRGYVMYKIAGNFTFRAWGLAPTGNCNTYEVKVYRPDGQLWRNGTFASNSYYEGSFQAGTFEGVWKIEVGYLNASGVTPANGNVTYYVSVGAGDWRQIITFENPGNSRAVGETFAPGAISSSGLAPTYSVNYGPATVSGGNVTITGVGQVGLTAAQIGSFGIAAAPPVSAVFNTIKGNQTISYNLTTVQNGTLTALGVGSVTSGGPLIYSIISGPASLTSASGVGDGAKMEMWPVPEPYYTNPPSYTRVVPTIDANWGAGPPQFTNFGNDGFKIVWSAYVKPAFSETYNIIAETDAYYIVGYDGQSFGYWSSPNLYVFTSGSVALNNHAISLSAGKLYRISLTYYNPSGNSYARLKWQSPSQPLQVIPQASLYSDSDMLSHPYLKAEGVGPVVVQIYQAGTVNYNPVTVQRTINVLPVPPVIASIAPIALLLGQPVSIQPTATNVPTSWTATGLPPGVSINSTSGAVTGVPSSAGLFTVTISASNAGGTGTRTFGTGVYAVPAFTGVSASTATQNADYSHTISATTTPVRITATGLPPGLAINPNTGVVSGVAQQPGVYPVSLTAANPGGSSSTTWTLTVIAATLPEIRSHPANKTVSIGQPASFTVAALGAPSPTFQWKKDGVSISGATNDSFTLLAVQTSDVGSYTVQISNSVGTVISRAANLAIGSAVAASDISLQAIGQDPNVDSDGDGIPDLTEAALGATADSAPGADSSNQSNLKIQRPPQ
jgi:hypothetical protein